MNLPVVELFLPLALAFIMFALGLTLVVADFKRVFLSLIHISEPTRPY